MDDHIQTLFGPSEEGYQPPPDPEPGDDAWDKLKWILYPLIVVAIFSHGTLAHHLNKVFWTLFVMGLLITAEWSELEKTRTRLCLIIAGVAHLCLMTACYNVLPEHKRLVAIILRISGRECSV
jgi:hypothetical protein